MSILGYYLILCVIFLLLVVACKILREVEEWVLNRKEQKRIKKSTYQPSKAARWSPVYE